MFVLRVLFFCFFMVLFGFLFRRVFVIYPPKKEKKSVFRLDIKNKYHFVLKLSEVINLKSSFCLLFVNCV